MALAAAAAHDFNEWGADAIAVDAGNGAGVIDRLRSLGYEVYEVPFGGGASDPGAFFNLRTELYWKMADAVKSGLKKASETVKNIKGAWVNEIKVVTDDNGNVNEWRVNLRITFVVS